MRNKLDARQVVAALKAAAEPTRLRILMLLAQGELNVKDLTEILGQSQPRVSRHLKLLAEAELIERVREGSWVYFYVADRTQGGELARRIIDAVDPDEPAVQRDRQRADTLKRVREVAAQTYFDRHAADWDHIRSLHVTETVVEEAIVALLGRERVGLLVDLGTGTGRMLELLAGRYDHAIGFDANHAMLSYARAKLSSAGIDHAQVRHGDLYALPLGDAVADAVLMHQVLHYLVDPARAIAEAARVLAPGGRLLIVDFAPHGLEFLRDAHAHERLGFATAQIEEWARAVGLTLQVPVTLPPHDGEGELTVTLWLATRPAREGRADSAADGQRKLEEAR